MQMEGHFTEPSKFGKPGLGMSYCQMLCMDELGGVLNFFNSIDKFYTSNDFADQFVTV